VVVEANEDVEELEEVVTKFDVDNVWNSDGCPSPD